MGNSRANIDDYDAEDLANATGDHNNPEDQNRAPSDWAKLRQEQKKVRDRDSQIATLQRDLAFRNAGINPEDKDAPPMTAMFVEGYKGELTTDAITAEAIKMGILKAPDPEPQLTAEQQQALKGQQQADAAADGATPPAGGPTLADLDKAHEAGGNEALAAELAKVGVPTITSP
jgi:hypothetical protein